MAATEGVCVGGEGGSEATRDGGGRMGRGKEERGMRERNRMGRERRRIGTEKEDGERIGRRGGKGEGEGRGKDSRH